MEFLKLEKIEFGGCKGQSLGQMIGQIFNSFNELTKKFTFSSYDPTDLGTKA